MSTHSGPETGERVMGLPGALARLYWMFFGNVLLVLLAAAIAQREGMTWRDPTFWAIALSVVTVRALDTLRLGGLTADGAPSTPAHVRRHAAILLPAAAVLWGLAKGLSVVLS